MSEFLELGSLWKKKDKEGRTYLNGKLSNKLDVKIAAELLANPGTGIFVFPNKYKTTDKHPDYRVQLAPPLQSQQRPPAPEPSAIPPIQDDDLPF